MSLEPTTSRRSNESLPERLDAIVNNAGIAVGGPMETRQLPMSGESSWKST